MSDTSQGPGWWQASDDRWYPPEAAPGGGASIPPPPGPAPSPGNPDAAGFVRSLYDFQFDHLVSPKLLRFFYGFFVIVLSISSAISALAALSKSPGTVIIIPIFYFLALIATRVYFELIAAFFRMADDVRVIRRNTTT